MVYETEHRILVKLNGEWVHQIRKKDAHIDSPTLTPVDRDWGEWEDVPIVYEKETKQQPSI